MRTFNKKEISILQAELRRIRDYHLDTRRLESGHFRPEELLRVQGPLVAKALEEIAKKIGELKIGEFEGMSWDKFQDTYIATAQQEIDRYLDTAPITRRLADEMAMQNAKAKDGVASDYISTMQQILEGLAENIQDGTLLGRRSRQP